MAWTWTEKGQGWTEGDYTEGNRKLVINSQMSTNAKTLSIVHFKCTVYCISIKQHCYLEKRSCQGNVHDFLLYNIIHTLYHKI